MTSAAQQPTHKNMMYKRTCAECNKEFESPAMWARYCGAACRQRNYRTRKANGAMVKHKNKVKQ